MFRRAGAARRRAERAREELHMRREAIRRARLGCALLALALLLSLTPVRASAAQDAEATPKPVDRTWKDIVSVAVGEGYTAALRADGQVLYAGRRDGDSLCAVEDWADVEKLYRSGDRGEYLVGLCRDGTARAIGPASSVAFDLSPFSGVQQVLIGQNVAAVLQSDSKVHIAAAMGDKASNDDGVHARYFQQRVSSSNWTQIRQLCFTRTAEGTDMLVGLRSDGMVAATDLQWADALRKENRIKALFAGPKGALLLLHDGTLLNSSALQQPSTVGIMNIPQDDWTNVAAFYPGADASYALTRDGHVLCGSSHESDSRVQEVLGWTEVVQLGYDASGGKRFVPAGLRADGTVLTVTQPKRNSSSAWDTSDWTGVTRLYSGSTYTLGLRADGTVLATGGEFGREDFVDQLSEWSGVAQLFVSDTAYPGRVHVVGLRYDGKLLAAGNNDYGQCTF